MSRPVDLRRYATADPFLDRAPHFSSATQKETMPRRPAQVTQADVARVIRAAEQEGVREIEVRSRERQS